MSATRSPIETSVITASSNSGRGIDLGRRTMATRRYIHCGRVEFEKWQALGNDYLIVERGALPFELTAARIRAICAPHTGVFADGILLLEPSPDPDHVAHMRIFNPDGSEAGLSGNGAREAFMYLRRRGWTDADNFSITTLAGTIRAEITSERTCRVAMAQASLSS